MEVKILYRYARADGGINVSPNKPDTDYTVRYRLIADEGMTLAKDGHEPTPCVDTDDTTGWSEIPEEV